jgi:phage recombination protein Bet
MSEKDNAMNGEEPGTITNFGIVPGEVTRVAVVEPDYDADKISLIKAKVAPNCTDTEFKLLMYMSQKYNLDPLLRQIWAVKFGNSPAQIYAGRDGFLEIAHRSGHFDGMKTDVYYETVKGKDGVEVQKIKGATCTVWRNDMAHPFVSDVLFSEYDTGKNLWITKPSVMIGKVAESVCLRKAFSVSGLYSPEEMG